MSPTPLDPGHLEHAVRALRLRSRNVLDAYAILAHALRARGHAVEGMARTCRCVFFDESGVGVAYAKEQQQRALRVDGQLWTLNGQEEWSGVLRRAAGAMVSGEDARYTAHFIEPAVVLSAAEFVLSPGDRALAETPGLWARAAKPRAPAGLPVAPPALSPARPQPASEADLALLRLQATGVRWNQVAVFKGLAALALSRGVPVHLLSGRVEYHDADLLAHMDSWELAWGNAGNSISLSAPAQPAPLPAEVAAHAPAFNPAAVQVGATVEVPFAPEDWPALGALLEARNALPHAEAWVSEFVAQVLSEGLGTRVEASASRPRL